MELIVAGDKSKKWDKTREDRKKKKGVNPMKTPKIATVAPTWKERSAVNTPDLKVPCSY